MSGVQVGIGLPSSGEDATPEAIAQVAHDAEAAALGSVWTYERLFPTVPMPWGARADP